MNFLQTLGRVFFWWIRRLDLFLGISLSVALINFLLSALVLYAFGSLLIGGLLKDYEDDPDKILDHILRYALDVLLLAVILLLVNVMTTVVGEGAMIHGVLLLHLEQPVDFVACLQKASDRKWSLLGARLLVWATVGVPAVLGLWASAWLFTEDAVVASFFVLLALFWWIVYASLGVQLVAPAVLAENLGAFGALARSWKLSARSGCYQTASVVGINVLVWVYSIVMTNVLDVDRMMGSRFGTVTLGLLLGVVPLVFSLSQTAVLDTVMYLNLRTGKEGMTPDRLLEDLAAAGGSMDRGRDDDDVDDRRVPLLDADDAVAAEVEAVVLEEPPHEHDEGDDKKAGAGAAGSDWVV